jgi:hypothetical protein
LPANKLSQGIAGHLAVAEFLSRLSRQLGTLLDALNNSDSLPFGHYYQANQYYLAV